MYPWVSDDKQISESTSFIIECQRLVIAFALQAQQNHLPELFQQERRNFGEGFQQVTSLHHFYYRILSDHSLWLHLRSQVGDPEIPWNCLMRLRLTRAREGTDWPDSRGKGADCYDWWDDLHGEVA